MNEKTILPVKTITIYSVGLLGGSIGLALKESGYKGIIIGLSSPSSIDTALSLGCIDEGYSYDRLGEVIKRTDLIFLCSPIMVILDTLKILAKLDLPKNLISTAKNILPEHVHFIGGHPMAGSEKSGPSASDPYLFQNAIYVLSPALGKPTETDSQFAHFLEQYLGCRYIFLDPEVHDTIAATVSHIPHMLAVALVNLAQSMNEKIPGTVELAAGGFRDLTRIASSPYKMWHDIFATNKKTIEPLLDQCIDMLSAMKRDLKKNNLSDAFTNASETRLKIPLHNKGFITPLHEILVIVKDQPGVIASISNKLAEKNVNIKDIEILKLREGEGGTLRLAFESFEIAKSAIGILNEIGFSARERI
jgi:prephenate dehydrogenase